MNKKQWKRVSQLIRFESSEFRRSNRIHRADPVEFNELSEAIKSVEMKAATKLWNQTLSVRMTATVSTPQTRLFIKRLVDINRPFY